MVNAFTNYISTNSQVKLYTFFVGYDTVYNYSIDDTVTDQTQIHVDETQSPFTDDLFLKIYPDLTVIATAPDVNDPNWIEKITMSLQI